MVYTILSKPTVIAGAGLAAATVYVFLSIFLIPMPLPQVDTEHFRHFVSANFAYASSIFDLSVMSPVQGMGGLVQPLAVWLNPSYLLPHLLTNGNPSVWSYIPVILMLMGATYLLGRGMGLPVQLAVIGAQLVAMFTFHPMYWWSHQILPLNGVLLYNLVTGIAAPAALEVTWLALFCYLGRLSTRWNIVCVALIPTVFIYGVLCDPLYSSVFLPPFALLAVGIYLGSGSKSVFIWRSIGGAVLLAVTVVLRVPQFYLALSGYAARAAFPNELYTEIQRWDYLTGPIFQGGLLTPLMILMLLGCLLTIRLGNPQAKGFAASVLLFVVGMIGVNLVYVYGGTRWGLPLPSYFETGVQPAYMVAGLLGAWHFTGKAAAIFRGSRWAGTVPGAPQGLVLTVMYGAIFLIPLLGTIFVLKQRPPYDPSFNVMQRESSAPMGVVAVLKENLAIQADGRFRGSVANIAGVPGGEISRYPESFPFTKDQVSFVMTYLRSFDTRFYMTGFWDLGIPTLEDNNPLVTPPFHFLISRALSRPQDYHTRNWTQITRVNPRLMAALGTRYILADRQLSDPLLTLRMVQKNYRGERVGLYEILDPNIGDYSPITTLVSTDATQALSLMASGNVSFRDTAVVHDAPLSGLVRAESGSFFYERGGFRVRAASRGTSLLVLPIQFSNSLRVVAAESGAGAPIRLIRVNLLETGVLFTGTINVKIAHVFGLFRDVKGRLRDIEDYKRLGIRETGNIPYPPGYQPLGGKLPFFGGILGKKTH